MPDLRDVAHKKARNGAGRGLAQPKGNGRKLSDRQVDVRVNNSTRLAKALQGLGSADAAAVRSRWQILRANRQPVEH